MPHEILDIILLLFTLALLAAICVIPYMILHKVVRVIIRTTKKTLHIFVDEN